MTNILGIVFDIIGRVIRILKGKVDTGPLKEQSWLHMNLLSEIIFNDYLTF